MKFMLKSLFAGSLKLEDAQIARTAKTVNANAVLAVD